MGALDGALNIQEGIQDIEPEPNLDLNIQEGIQDMEPEPLEGIQDISPPSLT